MDLSTIVRKGAAQHPDRVAISHDAGHQTYGELHARASRIAGALTGLGLAPGDRVATLTANGPHTVEIMAGVHHGGFVRAALDPHAPGESNLYLLDLIGAAALVVDARLLPAIGPVLPKARTLRHVVVFGGGTPEDGHDLEALVAAAPAEDPGVVLPEDAPHIIRFSAGTTGRPKGIVHTLGGWRWVTTEWSLALPRLGPDDRYLAAGPLTHAAMVQMFPTLAAGGRVVVMSAFHPTRFSELVESERCTVALVVPTMIQMILADPVAATTDYSSLHTVIYGAAPITDRVLETARGAWGDTVLHQIYGQSEAVPISVLRPEDHRGSRLRSAGRPTPNATVRILDEDGAELPRGEVGEIVVRTPAAMHGIWGDDDATAERRADDGGIRTRDMGWIDEDGFVHLADRKEDLIISGGFNIWPAEVENALAAHPAAAQVAVIGVPDEKWGETPKAIVVLAPGENVDAETLIAFSREKLGSVKRVTSVEFADELPRSPIEKVLRRVLRERYAPMAPTT